MRIPITQAEIYWHAAFPAPLSKTKVGELRTIGGHTYFAYDGGWLGLGIEISPGTIPLSFGTAPISIDNPGSPAYIPDAGTRGEYRGLPAPFYDSLPDRWGQKLIENFLGTPYGDLGGVEVLCHRGNRCMGAFSYHPATHGTDTPLETDTRLLDLYCETAAKLGGNREAEIDQAILGALEDSGGSVGGMRPKVLLAIHKNRKDVLRRLSGYDHEDMPPEFEPWLVKLDVEPDKYRGVIEETCARMARLAGVAMPETRLITTGSPSGEHRHFAVRRFDRELVGGRWHRVHAHSAAALLARDYNRLDLDYNELLELARKLTGDPGTVRQIYTRAVFNVLAGNSDDHAKNHAFLLGSSGKWRASPAYDLTPSQIRTQPLVRSTAVLGNKSVQIPFETLENLGAIHDVDNPRGIILETLEATGHWSRLAAANGLPAGIAAKYQARLDALRPAIPNGRARKRNRRAGATPTGN